MSFLNDLRYRYLWLCVFNFSQLKPAYSVTCDYSNLPTLWWNLVGTLTAFYLQVNSTQVTIVLDFESAFYHGNGLIFHPTYQKIDITFSNIMHTTFTSIVKP